MEFGGDERAQSVVIGSLLVFTILILSFSGYQAFVVPNQNARVEADHFQDVDAQFSELRSTVINSIGAGETRSTTIDLGTRYPTRTIALNPPPAAGRLETTDPGVVEVSDDTGPVNVCAPDGTTPTTRSLVYTPNYNEYQPPQAVGYENRMISREFRDGTLFEQRMVNSNTRTISLYLFNGSVSENGIKSYTLEVNGSRQFTTTLNNPTITVPSEYGGTTWNDDILAGEDVTATDAGNGRVQLDFSNEDWEVSCAVVGLDSEPAFTPPEDGSGSGGGSNVNPNAPGDIRLNGVASQTGPEVDLEFENLANSDRDATEARINFYQSQSGGVPAEANVSEAGSGQTSAKLEVKGPFEQLTPAITFTGNDTTEVRLDFDQNVNPNDWFVLTMVYDNDEVGQYFISIRDKTSSSPSGNALDGATAGDLGTSDTEQQELTFTLGRDLTSGETITIDLSDAQSGNGVDYSSSTVTDDASGTTAISGTGQVEITYTASGMETEGSTVTVTVSDVDASHQNADGTYDAVFDGPDGTTITEQFQVS